MSTRKATANIDKSKRKKLEDVLLTDEDELEDADMSGLLKKPKQKDQTKTISIYNKLLNDRNFLLSF